MSNAAPEWVQLFPGLQDIRDDHWLDVANRANELTVPADQQVFREGDDCEKYILVVAGATRVFKRFDTGREMVLYRLQAGQTCILTTSVLLAGGVYPADAMTDADTQVVLIPTQDFHTAFDQSKGFRDYVTRAFGGRIRDLIMLLESVVVRQVDVRLARWLVANRGDDGQVVVSHRELAFELGTAREVISRLLKDFERRELVKLSRRSIDVLDVDALERFVKA
jgi:CRP/FNR family transcriptional regulator